MGFILVFNIIVGVCLAIGLLVILATIVISKDLKNRQGEESQKKALIVSRVRGITYIAIFAIMIIMIIVNLIV